MRFRRGHAHWYDFVLIAIAAAIVYPDHVLEWLSRWTGKAYGWGQLIIYEIVAIGSLMGFTSWLTSNYPAVEWWHAAMMVGMVALFRFLIWAVTKIFGFDD
jgi:hypothetical protein